MPSFAGGLAEGFNSTFGAASQAGSRRRALEQAEQQATQARAAARVKSGVEIMNQIGAGIAATFQNPNATQQGQASQGPALDQLATRAIQRLGADMFRAGLAETEQEGFQRARDLLQISVQRQQTTNFQQSEEQRIATQGQVAQQEALLPGQVAEQQALTPGVVDRAGQVAEAQAAGTQRGRGPDTGQFVNFVNPQTGEFAGTVRRDSAEASALAGQGLIATTAQIQGGQEDVVGLQLTDRDRSKAAIATMRAAADVAKAATALDEITKAGAGVVGVRAVLGDKAGGFLGQINQALGDAASGFITGVSQEELGRLRANAQATARSLIAAFTGEEGGTRVTQSEQDTADRVSRIVDSPSSSFAQVQGALQEAIELQILNLDKQALIAGQGLIPLETDEEINAFGNTLTERLRLNEETALRIFDAIKIQRSAFDLVPGQK